ncbi:hypothetical protein G4B88_009082 [Cannabis sativa]|uniref:Cytochrome b561 domain-containing protein n=1 Tax=Cannabis sativa TaxID=3483 RepID=A0A7J6HPN1_CANSA|nr:hypothetical protein G4B88_001192 [Cannabis sativa]KAF4397236.1 hypothetical protein G4B88_009082 [Cannabis sativa]
MHTNMDPNVRRRGSGAGLRGLAYLFGVLSIILMIIWLLHFRGSIEYDSQNPAPMMAYRTVPAEMRVKKIIHMLLHIIAIVMGIIGLCAVFRYHNMINLGDMYSLHSWIGLTTFILYCLQWLVGFLVFMVGRSSVTKERMIGWHMVAGRALLFMSICAALTGLMEKAQFLGLKYQHEARLVNFLGLSILLFGVFVDLSIVYGRYI